MHKALFRTFTWVLLGSVTLSCGLKDSSGSDPNVLTYSNRKHPTKLYFWARPADKEGLRCWYYNEVPINQATTEEDALIKSKPILSHAVLDTYVVKAIKDKRKGQIRDVVLQPLFCSLGIVAAVATGGKIMRGEKLAEKVLEKVGAVGGSVAGIAGCSYQGQSFIDNAKGLGGSNRSMHSVNNELYRMGVYFPATESEIKMLKEGVQAAGPWRSKTPCKLPKSFAAEIQVKNPEVAQQNKN